MTIFDNIFPLGFGTNRFNVNGSTDTAGIARAARILADALDNGVSYIDVAGTYSKGTAEIVCREAFKLTNAKKNVTIKISALSVSTEEEAMAQLEKSFNTMGIDHASYFMCWNIANIEQFRKITQKGGIYDAALKAKEQGLVDHITFSSHAPPKEILEILNSRLFEGMTISYNVINGKALKNILDTAMNNNVGVAVMNPLAGGLIPQNRDYFSFVCGEDDSNTVQAALRYVYAHPAVKIVLSGISSSEELKENIRAFTEPCNEKSEDRIKRVESRISSINGFCTGCRYCDGCPRGINVFEFMQAYNTTIFPHPPKMYNRSGPKELFDNISICSMLKNTYGFIPDNVTNPCISCGRCEKHCTAHLPIIERIKEMYGRFEKCGFSESTMTERLRELIGNKHRIAFYPGGGYTAYVLKILEKSFPDKEFDISLYDTNASVWGNVVGGVKVKSPDEITADAPQIIIVSNYNYSDEIYNSLIQRIDSNIEIVKLHKDSDVPWVF